LEYEQPAKYIVNSTDYSDEYTTPVLTPGKTFIIGYTDEKDGIYKVNGGKVIIFDDFTTASRLIDFDFKVKSSAMKILTVSNEDLFDTEYMYLYLQTIHVNNNTHKRYWISDFATRSVKIHTIQEQKKIIQEIKRLYAIIKKVVG
jgi:type I restriction enzyme S subunit